MSRELWAAVALTFLVTMGSVFGATEGLEQSAPIKKNSKSSKVHSKKSAKPLQDQDIESGCSERFNPFRVKYADTVDQDICAS